LNNFLNAHNGAFVFIGAKQAAYSKRCVIFDRINPDKNPVETKTKEGLNRQAILSGLFSPFRDKITKWQPCKGIDQNEYK